jgi:hypothetical protein
MRWSASRRALEDPRVCRIWVDAWQFEHETLSSKRRQHAYLAAVKNRSIDLISPGHACRGFQAEWANERKAVRVVNRRTTGDVFTCLSRN